MTDRDKTAKDSETVMMALDQISQTIDVMTSVVGRLRAYVHERDAVVQSEQGPKRKSRDKGEANTTLH